ncbi:MAG TPA: hypothetical protein VJ870_13225 [Amycolatopsis sp.]|nr:hypothetical protein [Amycolatopsis sp.]
MAGFESNPGQPQPAASNPMADLAAGAALGGSMLSAQAIDATKAQVQKLVDSAKSGGFAIDEQGGDEYIRVFRDFEDVLNNLQNTVADASQSPKLGGSDYASRVAAHTVSIATGDAQSFGTALQSLTVIVQQGRQAFEEAKKRYAQMDDDARQTFGGAQA